MSWAEQEPTWAKLGPNLSRTRASCWLQLSPAGVQHGAAWARLDASWAQRAQLGPAWGHLVPKLGPRLLNAKRHRCLENVEIPVKTGVLRISYCPVMSPMLKRWWTSARATCMLVTYFTTYQDTSITPHPSHRGGRKLNPTSFYLQRIIAHKIPV